MTFLSKCQPLYRLWARQTSVVAGRKAPDSGFFYPVSRCEIVDRRQKMVNGLPYKSSNTFLEALRGHARLLKQLGMKPEPAP